MSPLSACRKWLIALGAVGVLLALAPAASSAATSLDDVACTSSSTCLAVGASDESGAFNVHAKRWNGSAWVAEAIPQPAGADTSRLVGVTCVSASSCLAVGHLVREEQGKEGLVLSWYGSGWAAAPLPSVAGAVSSQLEEVACASASACIAVGSYMDEAGAKKALALRWNGTQWLATSHPQPSEKLSELVGVSCVTSTNCVAVGSFVNTSNVTKTLASVWNGTSWSIVSTPEPSGAELSQLRDISCRPSDACTAVGNYSDAAGEEKTLALRRNVSGAWSIQTTPNQAGALSRSLTAVACPASTACTAVGFVEQNAREVPIALAWNGSTWASQAIDAEAIGASAVILTSVACLSTTDCNATGSVAYGRSAAPRNLAFRFNGTAWLVTEQGSYERKWVTFDAMRSKSEMAAVACPASHSCVGAGTIVDDTGANRAQVGVLKGGGWTVDAGPEPSGATSSQLTGASCASATTCWTVGMYVDSEDVQRALLLKWSASSAAWTVESPPVPTGAKAAVLASVECGSTSVCMAVGSYVDSEGNHRPLAMSFNGSSWSLTAIASPPNIIGSLLTSVSCATSTCMAVGLQQDGFGHEGSMAARWDGSSWTLATLPTVEGGAPNSLTGVSCVSAAYCLAVGSFRDVAAKKQGLAMAWNGTAWQQTTLPENDSSELAAVSCTSAVDCVAVGQDMGSSAAPSHIVRWDGSSWEVEPPANYLGASGIKLISVSCATADACQATGTASYGALKQSNAMLTYDGESWFASDTTTSAAGLRSVSCASGESCLAVGDSSEPVSTSGAIWSMADEDWTKVDAASVSGAYLTDVSCVKQTHCVMVGRRGGWPYRPLALSWNGTAATVQTTVQPAGRSSQLQGVSCATTTWCAAVGFSWPAANAGPTTAFIEIWNGSVWQLATVPAPAGAVATRLQDISCLSPTACTAVGSYTANGVWHGLIERWNGASWTASSISPPAGSDYSLKGISCRSASACTAVGTSTSTANGIERALAARWNGTSWTVETVPLPSDMSESVLDSVDCFSSTRCVATGRTTAAAGSSPFVVAWASGAWAVEAALKPAASGDSNLTSVSCPSAGDCRAVGRTRIPGHSAEPLMMQSEGEDFEDSTDPVQGPLEPSPTLTSEQKEEALAVMEEDPAYQAALGASEHEPKVVAWTESDEASEEHLVGAYVELTLDEDDAWPERAWPVADYETGDNGYEGGEYIETEVEVSAAKIETVGICVDLTFDAGENVIDGEVIETFPLALESGEVTSDEQVGDWGTVTGY